MSEREIPEEAIEVAVKAWDKHMGFPVPHGFDALSDEVRVILKAAAPYLMAKAWDEGQDAGANDQMEVDRSLQYGLPEPSQTPNPYRNAL